MTEPLTPAPCPFCGLPLVLNEDKKDFVILRYGPHYQHQRGTDCLMGDHEFQACDKDAMESWNRRTATQAPAEPPSDERIDALCHQSTSTYDLCRAIEAAVRAQAPSAAASPTECPIGIKPEASEFCSAGYCDVCKARRAASPTQVEQS